MTTGEKRISFGIGVIVVLTLGGILKHGWAGFAADFAVYYLVMDLCVLASALNQRAWPVCIAWGVVTFIGMPVFGSIAGLASEAARPLGFLAWGIAMCVLSFVTRTPRKKCPSCAEKISAEAVKCRYCGEFMSLSKA